MKLIIKSNCKVKGNSLKLYFRFNWNTYNFFFLLYIYIDNNEFRKRHKLFNLTLANSNSKHFNYCRPSNRLLYNWLGYSHSDSINIHN